MVFLTEACSMKKVVPEKGNIEHYIVRLTLTDWIRTWYLIFEKTQTSIQWQETFYDDDSWQTVSCADRRDLQSVLARLQRAQTKPGYDPLLANCEQFARFVVEGESYSTQVRAGMLIAGIVFATTLIIARQK